MATLNPDEYLKCYTAALDPHSAEGGGSVKEDGGSVGGLPLLPEHCYYSGYRPRRLVDGLSLDVLTREELLWLLEEAGAGRPAAVTGERLTAWLGQNGRALELERRLAEREQRLAEIEERLMAIRGGYAWRVYQAARPVLTVLRRLLSRARRTGRR